MKWKIEVLYKPETPDTVGQGILQDIGDLGLTGVKSINTAKVYWVDGDIDEPTIDKICAELLSDPVTQNYIYGTSEGVKVAQSYTGTWTIEVRLKSGVTDAVGDSVVKGIQDMGISGVQAAQTGEKYRIQGHLELSIVEAIAQRLLANEVIQTFAIERKT